MSAGLRHLFCLALVALALAGCAVVKEDYGYLDGRASYGPGGNSRD